ncbi:hypothetical protein [Comamonas sp. CMM02]|uniref:hypothetical protein n=1 Tax=Comamonas sp. CMM02 TaxID=2769307 RepID=UPI001784ACE9|nr:hypothetical protein [Comamonas sp. CMM02]MBD9402825.1 hypothetical protein [Comamonas sp. CMM02]
MGGKPLDPQKPGDNILPGSPADPLPIITLAVPPRDKEAIDSSLSGVMGGAPVLDDIKGKNYISHYPSGTQENAEKVFNSMPLRDVISINSDYGGWGRRGTLPDGTMVIVRPSKDGRPTIEIQDTNRPGGTRRVQEIRFGEK